MKKITGILTLFVAIFIAVALPAFAEVEHIDDSTRAARMLYSYGLFRGVGELDDGAPDFALENPATRGEAITMLVRLLGAEKEALENSYYHPFTDAGWASDYIGYAYHYSISNGVSDTSFGTSEYISISDFLTLILRAMGYDVDWHDPYPTADMVGIDYYEGECYRADIAIICESALYCRVNNSDYTLYDYLVSSGAISSEDNTVYINAPDTDTFINSLLGVMDNKDMNTEIYIPSGREREFIKVLEEDMPRFASFKVLDVESNVGSGIINIGITYDGAGTIIAYLKGRIEDPGDELMEALEKALSIDRELTYQGMSDHDKIKAYHDYLAENIVYKNTGDRGHNVLGALIDGKCVCEGYVEAMELLCYIGGVDCMQVTGTGYTKNGPESHAWNKVYLDDMWYNVDITWDDLASGKVRYKYFLVSDEVMSADHTWVQYSNIPESPHNYGE